MFLSFVFPPPRHGPSRSRMMCDTKRRFVFRSVLGSLEEVADGVWRRVMIAPGGSVRVSCALGTVHTSVRIASTSPGVPARGREGRRDGISTRPRRAVPLAWRGLRGKHLRLAGCGFPPPFFLSVSPVAGARVRRPLNVNLTPRPHQHRAKQGTYLASVGLAVCPPVLFPSPRFDRHWMPRRCGVVGVDEMMWERQPGAFEAQGRGKGWGAVHVDENRRPE